MFGNMGQGEQTLLIIIIIVIVLLVAFQIIKKQNRNK